MRESYSPDSSYMACSSSQGRRTRPHSTNIGLGQASGHRKWRAVTCSMFSRSSEDDCGLVVLSPFGRSFSLDSRMKTSLRKEQMLSWLPATHKVREKEVFVLQAPGIWVPVNHSASCAILMLSILLTFIWLHSACSFLGPFMSASEVLVGRAQLPAVSAGFSLWRFPLGFCDF